MITLTTAVIIATLAFIAGYGIGVYATLHGQHNRK
jgi:hypothetical protein